jgi:hypothetical protein
MRRKEESGMDTTKMVKRDFTAVELTILCGKDWADNDIIHMSYTAQSRVGNQLKKEESRTSCI